MTEVGITHFNQDDDCRYKSVGKLMDLVEMKVRVIIWAETDKLGSGHKPRLKPDLYSVRPN